MKDGRGDRRGQYFGFSFEYKGQVYYGYHTIASFGLSTLPHAFTKLMKPWVKKWRDARLHLFLYLDDGLGACKSRAEACFFYDMVRRDLVEAAIVTQLVKCNWDPVTELIAAVGARWSLFFRKRLYALAL